MPIDEAVSSLADILVERPEAELTDHSTDQGAVRPAPAALRIKGVGKRFRSFASPWDRVLSAFWPSRRKSEDIWALRNIDIEIKRGECFGIMGVNGSGKSTLLKMVAGALYPTEGDIEVNGRVLALLELGAGLNPELTARENVRHATAMLGMPADYAARNLPAIEEFADVGTYFDRPMKTFSSGMFVRVAFALYMFLDPEIFIIDEALSVGDVFFQQKCADAMRQLVERGTTIILVTHDTSAICAMCDRAALLRNGRCEMIGDPREVVNLYHATLITRPRGRAIAPGRRQSEQPDVSLDRFEQRKLIVGGSLLSGDHRTTTGEMEINGFRIVTDAGEPTLVARCREKLRFQFVITAHATIVEPNVGIALSDRFGMMIFATSCLNLGCRYPTMEAGDVLDVEIEIQINLRPGDYVLMVNAADKHGAEAADTGVFHDQHDRLGPLKVYWTEAMSPFYGIAELPARVVGQPPC